MTDRDPIDEDLERALKLRLQTLDDAHRHATSPLQRRNIEERMQKAIRELETIRARKQTVDLEYERWKRAFLDSLKERLA